MSWASTFTPWAVRTSFAVGATVSMSSWIFSGVGSRVWYSPATLAMTSTVWRPCTRNSGSVMVSSREVVQERYSPPSTR